MWTKTDRDIRPIWVLVNDELRHVSEFSDLPYEKKPECYCPVCDNKVILKLGKINVHHYAHRADDICAVSKPETALHLNTKIHIYQKLLTGKSIKIASGREYAFLPNNGPVPLRFT